MGRLVLITGGARSGKSRHAVSLAKEAAGGATVAFVATCVPGDDELRDRVKKHKEARPPEWLPLEAAQRPSRAVERAADGAQILAATPADIICRPSHKLTPAPRTMQNCGPTS